LNAELEERAQTYLFMLRQSVGDDKLLARQFSCHDWSETGHNDQGWGAVEARPKLSAW
jgi:hypothetical protein